MNQQDAVNDLTPKPWKLLPNTKVHVAAYKGMFIVYCIVLYSSLYCMYIVCLCILYTCMNIVYLCCISYTLLRLLWPTQGLLVLCPMFFYCYYYVSNSLYTNHIIPGLIAAVIIHCFLLLLSLYKMRFCKKFMKVFDRTDIFKCAQFSSCNLTSVISFGLR